MEELKDFEIKALVNIKVKCVSLKSAKEHILNGFYDSWDLLEFKEV